MQHGSQNYTWELKRLMRQQRSKGSLWKEQKMKRLRLVKYASAAFVLTLLVSVLSLTGCASRSHEHKPVLVYAPTPIPSPPVLSTPIPSQSYSSVAASDIVNWRKKLTDTHPMH